MSHPNKMDDPFDPRQADASRVTTATIPTVSVARIDRREKTRRDFARGRTHPQRKSTPIRGNRASRARARSKHRLGIGTGSQRVAKILRLLPDMALKGGVKNGSVN
jgi:hypothetical protein